jgi:two-component system, NarL family, sensor histidine kinase DesK
MFKPISPKKIGWEPYVYLVYLLFLFFQLLYDPERSWSDVVLIGFLIAVFLPLYFWGFRQQGRTLYLAIALTVLLGFGGMFFNSGSAVFFIYAAAASAGFLPRTAWRLIGAILCVVVMSALLSPLPFPWRIWAYAPAFLVAPLIGLISIFQAEKGRSNLKLKMAQSEIEHLATIAERERIARDLHDVLGHTLSVIALKSELANKLLEQNPNKARQEMQDVERISRQALSEVRTAVTGYRSKGLTAEVAQAKLALESAGVSFAYQNTVTHLSSLQESTLSLVVREAVTNIIRHANATRCTISLSEDDNDIKLEIADNGCGFNDKEGSGLSGMRGRVQALGGTFVLENISGVRLHVSLPKVERNVQLVSSLTTNEVLGSS